MNYEELIDSRRGDDSGKLSLPYGKFYRTQSGGKYVYVIDVYERLSSNIVFAKALEADSDQNHKFMNSSQLHYNLVKRDDSHITLELEHGAFVSLKEYVIDHPAAVLRDSFLYTIIGDLLRIGSLLHEKGLWHVCFSPETIFLRKNSDTPLLLVHGSRFLAMSNPYDLYCDGTEYFVAPEVMNSGSIDQRCDIYSIGKLIEWLFRESNMPSFLKSVVGKATQESPEDRYETADKMWRDINRRRRMRSEAISLLTAIAVAAVVVGIYFSMIPEPVEVEYVKPAPKKATDELYEHGFDPYKDMGIIDGSDISPAMRDSMAMYQAKSEQIFRKRFEQEAERILDELYSNKSMASGQSQFLSHSEEASKKLQDIQLRLADESGLDDAKSQSIAASIIDRITEAKKPKK